MLSAVQEAKLAEVASRMEWDEGQVGEARASATAVLDHMVAFGPRRSVRAAAELLRLNPSLVEDVLGRDFRVAA